MPLTNKEIANASAKEKPIKLYDERGLFLLVNPNGSKWWRFKYRIGGKEKSLSFGTYPDVSLKEARDKREAARRMRGDGIDPAAHRRVMKETQHDANAHNFEVIAREWFAKRSATWKSSHSEKIINRLEHDIFPHIGKRPVAQLTAPEVLAVLRRIESRGAIETAHRAMQNCSQVFRYAVATGRAERDPTFDLRGALTPVQEQHHAAITDPKGVGELLRSISGYRGSPVVRHALRLAPLVFVRPGELRKAEWMEFDLDAAEWRIPGERMKMGQQHIVPLSQQAVVILGELHKITGSGKYVFPSIRTRMRPMSENTVTAALRRLGYTSEEMTGHGFRSMASTLLNEQGWHRDAIERQLAHSERNAVRAAYNYAEHLSERRKMMQAWADYLDDLARNDKTEDLMPVRPHAGEVKRRRGGFSHAKHAR